jgi:hypothetical protein
MKTPPLDPNIADVAPAGPALAVYDEEHLITYMRVLDADQQGTDWREVSRIVLRVDPDREAERARLPPRVRFAAWTLPGWCRSGLAGHFASIRCWLSSS